MSEQEIFRILLFTLLFSNRQLEGEDGEIDYGQLNNLILLMLLTKTPCPQATESQDTTF